MTQIAFTGDRHYTDVGAVLRVLCRLREAHGPFDILVGDCPTGVDAIVLALAEWGGVPCRVFTANWDKFGLAAGPFRNEDMILESPDLVVAIHDNLAGSKGTKGCVNLALKYGRPVDLVERGLARRLTERVR